MSGFVRQNGTACAFTTADSWVILNPIEQSIKRKIEAVGVPLKDWDIQINYGIKTGCNEAFIIDEAKRAELIKADPKSAEIIRPILRGRDIKRYGYTWANLYLIATFPSRHYDIDDYPAVKDYLLTFDKQRLLNAHLDEIANSDILLRDFCHQRLEQCGKDITINGHRVLIDGKAEKSRKKTGNKWFETQDQIGYWEDFSKPKIVWKRIGSLLRFTFDDNKNLCLDSTCFAIGENVKYLSAVLNSHIGNYLFASSPKTGTGDLIVSVQAFTPVLVPKPTDEIKCEIEKTLDCIIMNDAASLKEQEYLEQLVQKLFSLTDSEMKFILKYSKQFRE